MSLIYLDSNIANQRWPNDYLLNLTYAAQGQKCKELRENRIYFTCTFCLWNKFANYCATTISISVYIPTLFFTQPGTRPILFSSIVVEGWKYRTRKSLHSARRQF